MKSKIPWLCAGFLAAFAFLHGTRAYVDMPRDRTIYLPESTRRQLDEAGLNFLKNAYHENFDSLDLYRPVQRDSVIAYATIGPKDKQGQIIFYDQDKDGVPDHVVFMDKAWHHIGLTDRNNDGVWDQWDFSQRPRNGVSYVDLNLDGQPDIALDVERKATSVFLDRSWHSLVVKDKRKYIEVGGELREVMPDNGIWKYVPQR